MSRPHGWDVLDLDRDPTPGEPHGVRVLARSAERMALDADRLVRDLRGVAGDGPLLEWLGASGDAVRASLEEFPEHVVKLRDSYDLAGEALHRWAETLTSVQDQADRALEDGRDARADLDALQSQLASARVAAGSSARAAADAQSDPGTVAAPGPDPEQVRRALSAARADGDRVASLDRQADAAESRLEAAKRLARQARELREDRGRATGRELRDAADAGIPPNSLWQDIKSAAAEVWKATVKVATVVAIVVAVVALFVGGPLVWAVLLAASLVLLADSLIRYSRGEGSAWEVGLSLLGVVPGGRLLTALGKAAGLTRVGASAVAATTRGLAAGRAAVTRMTQGLRDGLGRLAARLPVGDAGHLTLPLPVARRLDEARLQRDFPDLADRGLPSRNARDFQTGDLYPGQDAWVDAVALPGDRFWVGMPFPGRFVVPDDQLGRVGSSARRYYEGVQVQPRDFGGGPTYRSGGLDGFEVVKPMPVAESRALANPHWGDGGLDQAFLPGKIDELVEAGYLKPVGHQPLPDEIASRIPETGRPLPPTPETS